MAIRSISHKAAIGAAWLVAWRMATRALGFLSTLVMARILVPSDFGLVAMATTFSGAVDALSQMGLAQALMRRKEDDERLHDTAFTLQVVRAVVTGAVIAVLAPTASAWFDEPRLTAVVIAIAGISILSGFRNIGVVAFGREMHYSKQVVVLAVPRILQVLVTVPLALLMQSYWVLIIGIAVSKTLDVVVTYIMHPFRPHLSFVGWRELAGFSFWSWAASIATIVWDRCDPFVIGPVLGTSQLGIFLVAFEVAALPVSEMVAPVADVLFAGFSMAQKEGLRPVEMALPVASALLLLIMPMMVAVSSTASYVVVVALGPSWRQAQEIIAVLAWMGLFAPFSYVCSNALVSAGYLRSNFLANCLASAIKLALLSATVAFTQNLLFIAMMATLTHVGEASAFVGLLLRTGETRLKGCIAPLFRILAAGGVTVALATATGLSFRLVSLTPAAALAVGLPLGLSSIVVFSLLTALLWLIAGKPEGPEIRVSRLLVQIAEPVLERLRTVVQITRVK